MGNDDDDKPLFETQEFDPRPPSPAAAGRVPGEKACCSDYNEELGGWQNLNGPISLWQYVSEPLTLKVYTASYAPSASRPIPLVGVVLVNGVDALSIGLQSLHAHSAKLELQQKAAQLAVDILNNLPPVE